MSSREEAGRLDRGLLASVVFAVLFAQVLVYPGVPDLVAALGATTTLDASMWFLAAEFGAFIAFAGLWGALSDVFGTRLPLIRLGGIGGGVGYLALAVSPALFPLSFTGVLLLRALQGALTIAAFSLAMTTLMDLPGGHGRNMGAAGIAIGLGTALGAPVGGQLTAMHPLAPLYVSSGVLVASSVFTLGVTVRPPTSRDGRLRAALRDLSRRPTLGVPFTFGFVDRLSAGFFALVGTLYFRTVFGLDAAATGLVLALFFAPFALLQYPFGVLSDRIGRTIPVVGGSLLYGVAVIAVGLAPTITVASVTMVVVGIVGAFMAPATMALVTDLADASDRGAAMGGFNVFGSVGFLAGIVGGGVVADAYGYVEAFLAVGLLEMLIAAVMLPVVLRLDLDGERA